MRSPGNSQLPMNSMSEAVLIEIGEHVFASSIRVKVANGHGEFFLNLTVEILEDRKRVALTIKKIGPREAGEIIYKYQNVFL